MTFLHQSHMVPSLPLESVCTLDEVTNPMLNLLLLYVLDFFFVGEGEGGRGLVAGEALTCDFTVFGLIK